MTHDDRGCCAWLALPRCCSRAGRARRNPRRALREGQGRKGGRVLLRRTGGAAREPRQAVHAAISRHRGVGHRRLQQRAERADRKADGREASSRSTWRSSRPCRISSTWKRQGKLLAFKPDGFDQIMPNFRDPDGAYMALSANALTYAYNTNRRCARGRAEIGARFPQAHVHGQDDQRLSGRRRRRALSVPPDRAEVRLGLDGQIHGQQAELRAGPSAGGAQRRLRRERRHARRLVVGRGSSSARASVEVVFSPVDETPVFTLTGGIFKDAPHPNAAKLYLTWFLAKEQQSRLGSFSSRADVPPPRGLQAADLVQDRQQLSRVHGRREADRRPAQALRGVHRPAGEQGRGAVMR